MAKKQKQEPVEESPPLEGALKVLSELPVDLYPDDRSKVEFLVAYRTIRRFRNATKTLELFAARLLEVRAAGEDSPGGLASVDALKAKYALGDDDMWAIMARAIDEGKTDEEVIADFDLPEIEAAPEPEPDIVDIAMGAAKKGKAKGEATRKPLPGQQELPLGDATPEAAADPKKKKKRALKVDQRISYRTQGISPVLGRVTAVNTTASTCDFVDDNGTAFVDIPVAKVTAVKDDVPGLPEPSEPDEEFSIQLSKPELKKWQGLIDGKALDKKCKQGAPVISFTKKRGKDTMIYLSVIGATKEDPPYAYAYAKAIKTDAIVAEAEPSFKLTDDFILQIDDKKVRLRALVQ